MANLSAIGRGDTALLAHDLYADDGATREIALDPRKTPQQNAARYYKEHTKLKNAQGHLTELIAQGEREQEYLRSVMEAIRRADGERGIEELRRELSDAGYMRQRRKAKPGTRAESSPMSFLSDSGMEILVGRNNAQNDRLTHRVAARGDIWLHAREVPGAHVIVRTGGAAPDKPTLERAAALAAWHSGARDEPVALVDYCPARYVKRQPGGRPGMVIYNNFQTMAVKPEEAREEA
jgi:predicted ribosome quality control (RQC) complex YloA/Tae2 family protein